MGIKDILRMALGMSSLYDADLGGAGSSLSIRTHLSARLSLSAGRKTRIRKRTDSIIYG